MDHENIDPGPAEDDRRTGAELVPHCLGGYQDGVRAYKEFMRMVKKIKSKNSSDTIWKLTIRKLEAEDQQLAAS